MVNKRKGFTLVEVVMALVIVGLSLVSVLTMFQFSSRMTDANKKKVVAYTLLERKREEIMTRAFSTNVAESDFQYTGYPAYRINVDQVTPYAGNAYLKEVSLIIEYPLAKTSLQTQTMTFIVANCEW